jgi:hypothetical protein
MNAWLIAALVTAAATVPAGNSALGPWLPNPDTGFTAWSNGQTAMTAQYDYFVCGSAHTPSVPKQDFDYPGSACPLFTHATAFEYAPEVKGSVVYDAAHAIVLYKKGCCAERGFALASGIKKPPRAVASADLSQVHTMRGIALGMSAAQVQAIYGPSKLHDAKGLPGVAALAYTTMKGTPTKPQGEPCGQYQSFFFRQGRVVSIELLTGC